MRKLLFTLAAGLLGSVGLHAETTVIPHPFTVGEIDDQFKAVYFTDQNFSRAEWQESYSDGRLLWADEWKYVLTERTINYHSADQLRGWATIIKDGGSDQKTEDILQLGLVLLPDDWGYTHYYDNNAWYANPNYTDIVFTVGQTFSNNVFTETDWAAMQQAGAVFLPCEPREEKVYGSGDYWSSTKDGVGGISYAFFETSRTTSATETFQINPNGDASEQRFVRLVQDHATITLDENEDNTDLLNTWKTNGKQVNVKLIRSLTPGMYNTFCLPFDLNAKEVKEVFGETTKLAKFQSGILSDDKTILNIDFVDIDFSDDNTIAIEAGVPYLIQPTNAVVNPIFNNRIIKCTNADGESFSPNGAIEYLGIINPHQLEAGNKKYLFLQANNTLTWSKEGDTSTMKGMRGYFYVPDMQDMPAKCPARLSVRPAPQTPTGLGQRNKDKGQRTIKFMRNGKLFIEYNGVIYNMQGGREL